MGKTKELVMTVIVGYWFQIKLMTRPRHDVKLPFT